MSQYEKYALPTLDSDATKGFNGDGKYRSCYNLILLAERDALNALSLDPKNVAKQKNLICARVTGGFLIQFYAKRSFFGDGPALEIVKQVDLATVTNKLIYEIGRRLCDRLINAFRTHNRPPPTTSDHPSRTPYDTLEDMLSDTLELASEDYETARNKTLARDGFKCMVSGWYNISSVRANVQVAKMAKGKPQGPVEICHIVNESTMQKLGDDNRLGHAASVMNILKMFRLDTIVEKLMQKNGIHGLYNLLTLNLSLHYHFDALDLWFEATDEPNVYEVCSADIAILQGYSSVDVRPHFQVNSEIKGRFRNARLDLPDAGLLAIHAVCARVAHMSGAAEYFDHLERDVDDALFLTEDNLHLLDNKLSTVSVFCAQSS